MIAVWSSAQSSSPWRGLSPVVIFVQTPTPGCPAECTAGGEKQPGRETAGSNQGLFSNRRVQLDDVGLARIADLHG